MSKIEKVLVTGKTHTSLHAADGRLDLELSTPGLNQSPEQTFAGVQGHPLAERLFAGAWSACYSGALGLAAQQRKATLPADMFVDIEVDLGMRGGEYFLQARLTVALPGLDRKLAQEIVDAAHHICPYSKAVSGNIEVTTTLA